jgi:hypothetical protein
MRYRQPNFGHAACSSFSGFQTKWELLHEWGEEENANDLEIFRVFYYRHRSLWRQPSVRSEYGARHVSGYQDSTRECSLRNASYDHPSDL